MLLTAGVSLVRALRAPGGDRASTKFVEWVRDHGGGSAVNSIEHWWYTRHAPPVGGRPPHGVPAVHPSPGVRRASDSGTRGTRPPDVASIVSDRLPGEGVWQPSGKLVHGVPALYETFVRPDTVHTSLLTGLVWMNTSLMRAVLHNGLAVPGHGPWLHGDQITASEDGPLVAVFNSGFRLNDSRGGYFTEGRTVRPLVDGRASLVIDDRGRPTVVQWGRDVRSTAGVESVRQNLDLIVDGGQAVPGLGANGHSRWGATVGGAVDVWRSGVGIDRAGNLVYAAGPGLNIETLADVLTRAGCVRAMELDINWDWVTFDTYQGSTPSDIHGAKLLAGMERSGDAYLHPGSRDFIAMLAR